MILGALPILILVINMLLPKNQEKQKASKLFMIFCCIIVVLFVGLRSRYTGSGDTNNYARIFEGLGDANFFKAVITPGQTIFDFMFDEGGFSLYMWSIAQLFDTAQPFIFISGAITTILVARFIYKNSEDKTVSWIAYICLGLMTFNLNGMRQSLAMAICLAAYDFAKEKNFIKFFITVFLAFTFHKTAFIFLIVYPLCNYRPSFIKNVALGVIAGLFLIFSRQLAALYDGWAGKDYASGESFDGGGGVIVAIYVLLIALSVMYVCFVKGKNSLSVRNLGILLGAGFIFYFSRYISTQIFERVSYYFFYFSLLVFPNLSDLFNKESKSLYKVIIICLAIVLFWYRISKGSFANYMFFWQETF